MHRLFRCCRRTSDFRKRSRSAHQVDGSEDECLLLAPPDSRRVVGRRTLVPSCRDRHRHPAQTALGSRLSSPPAQEPVVSEISDSNAAHQNCCRSSFALCSSPRQDTASDIGTQCSGPSQSLAQANQRVGRFHQVTGWGTAQGIRVDPFSEPPTIHRNPPTSALAY